MKFRKGDIVGRLSYNKDIVFTVSNIIKCRNQDIAILKGLVTRIEADSPLDDLELIDNNRVINLLDSFEKELEKSKKNLVNVQNNMFKRYYQHYGRILHLDGDRKYSEKSQKVYNCKKQWNKERRFLSWDTNQILKLHRRHQCCRSQRLQKRCQNLILM